MENENKEVAQEPTINLNEEIEKLKQEKENILRHQEEQSKQLEELNKLKAEVEELKKFQFPKEPNIVPVDNLELIRKKFEKVDYAIEHNFPKGHPERTIDKTASYMGTSLLEGYVQSRLEGKSLEEIFKNPLED